MGLIIKHWLVTLYPDEYAVSGEIKYQESCQALTAELAIAAACRTCEDINCWPAGTLDPATVQSQVRPDLAENARALLITAQAQAEDLAAAERAPTGDDYNALFSLVRAWLDQEEPISVPPIIKLVCNCCKSPLWGRQWVGQRQGFGLCDGCIEICSWGPTGAPSIDDYGHPTIHYKVKRDPAT